MRRGFAVLDFETTGFSPKLGDRVVEVGAAYMTPDLTIHDRFESLINPRRDVGPTHIHGISASDVFDAPTFDEVAPQLLELLDGRVIVGHNVSFDLRFLAAELDRAGYPAPEFVTLDTMHLSRRLLCDRGLPGYKLKDVAAHFGIVTEDVCSLLEMPPRVAHTALGDVLVTTMALANLISLSRRESFWLDALSRAEGTAWPARVVSGVKVKCRGGEVGGEPHSLIEVINAVGNGTGTAGSMNSRNDAGPTDSYSVAGSTDSYSHLLGDVLSDRFVDGDELDTMIRHARTLGLGAAELQKLHHDYLDGVIKEAWGDGIITGEEIADVEKVAKILGIDRDTALAKAVSQPGRGNKEFPVGSAIVLTGSMTRPRSEVEADLIGHGFVIGKGVTKKTAMLITADTKSQSGKAKRARELGIPVVNEKDGFELLGIVP